MLRNQVIDKIFVILNRQPCKSMPTFAADGARRQARLTSYASNAFAVNRQ